MGESARGSEGEETNECTIDGGERELKLVWNGFGAARMSWLV